MPGLFKRRKRNEIILQIVRFLFDRFSKKPRHYFIENKDISKTAFSAPFSLTLKQTTLSEQGV